MKKILFLFLLLSMFCKAQKPENLTITSIQFESIFGININDSSNIYSLLGTGFFRTPRSENSDSLINQWIITHPNAIVYPVSSLKNTPKSDFIYCWVIENNDTLNNYLIKNGCFPGGTMMRPKTWNEMKNWERKLYKDANEKVIVKVYVDKKTYNKFIEQIKVAELFASKNMLGIWKKNSK